MNYTQISSIELHELLGREFQLLKNQELKVVHLMHEIDRRRIWAERGFSSFLKYCVESFKISEADFFRKKALLDTIREIPEVEAKIELGFVTATAVTYAATQFRREAQKREVTREEKSEWLTRLEGKSCSEAKQELAKFSPETATPPDRIKNLDGERVVRSYTSDSELEAMIKEAQGIFNYKDYADLLKKVLRLALDKKKPQRHATQSTEKQCAITEQQVITQHQTVTKHPAIKKRRRYISLKVKRAVRERDEHRCSYVDLVTGRRCNQTARLEFDHVTPFAVGGDDSVQNLRLRCRAHNALTAAQFYGEEKMRVFRCSPNR
jgi:5-methylcytosine-specific restriction endonuclease McrA